MAARTCLLCGKALSRIWAGTEEDFCSREHRNQYRLRRGMDRLLEANKVASVMRRRESPKQIPPSALRSGGPSNARGFLTALRSAPPSMIFPATQFPGKTGMSAGSHFAPAKASASPMNTARHFATAIDFTFPPLRAPRPAAHLKVHVQPAGPARSAAAANTSAEHRTLGTPLRTKGRPSIDGLLARSGRRPAAMRSEARPARRLTAACRGKALRVSTSAGFRVPERKLPVKVAAAVGAVELVWPDVQRLTAAAAPAKVEAMTLSIETAPQAVRLPSPPEPNFERRFRWPGAFEMPLESRNTANDWRLSAVPFAPPDEFAAKERK